MNITLLLLEFYIFKTKCLCSETASGLKDWLNLLVLRFHELVIYLRCFMLDVIYIEFVDLK